MIPAFPVYLFDIDGTLLDSAEDICSAIQQVLVANGSAPRNLDYLKRFIGLHLNECFRDALPHYTPDLSEEFTKKRRSRSAETSAAIVSGYTPVRARCRADSLRSVPKI